MTMARAPFFSSFAFMLPAIVLLLASAASAAPTQGATASDWVALNTTLSGRLQQGVPLALPCFDNLDGKPSNRNTTACANVLTDFTQADFRKDFEGASMLVSKFL